MKTTKPKDVTKKGRKCRKILLLKRRKNQNFVFKALSQDNLGANLVLQT